MQISMIQNSLRAMYSNASKMADAFLTKYPDAVKFAQEKKLEDLQHLFEAYIAKENALPYVESCIEEKVGSAFKEECEAANVDFNLAVKTLAFIAQAKGQASDEMLFGFLKGFIPSLQGITEFLEDMEAINAFTRTDTGYRNYPGLTLSKECQETLSYMVSNIPMVCPPRKTYRNKEGKLRGGYLTLKYDLWAEGADPHEEVPLDFINKQNAIPYGINWEVWDEYLKNPDIPYKRENEQHLEYQSKVQLFLNTFQMKVFFLELIRRLGIEKVYLLNFFDHRGRNYPKAYIINPQGIDIDKAILKFPEERINLQGTKWLAISAANCLNIQYEGKDVDKHTFEKRLECFDKELLPLFNFSEPEFKEALKKKMEQAESKWCFMHQMLALWKIQKQVKLGQDPTVSCITHWDATASGSQINGIWMFDWKTMKIVNLVDPEARLDGYTIMAQEMYAKGLPERYSRSYLKKKFFIPKNYGSVNCLKEAFPDPEEQEIVMKIINSYSMYSLSGILRNIWDETALEYSWNLPDGFKVFRKIRQAYGDPSLKKHKEFKYVFKGHEFYLNFEVNEPVKSSVEYGPNVTHSADGYIAREIARRISYDPETLTKVRVLQQNKQFWEYSEDTSGSRAKMQKLLNLREVTGMTSMAFLEEVNKYNIDMIPKEMWEVINQLPMNPGYVSEIHDSFGVTPNHVEDLMQAYRYCLADLAQGRLIESIIDSLKHLNPFTTFKEPDPKVAEAILNSKYALC